MRAVGRYGGRAVGNRAIAVLLFTALPAYRLTAQCPDGSPPPCAGRGTRPIPTVAVLYFDNRSRDSADAYLADGLTEQTIAQLGEVRRMTVASRYAVGRFRGAARQDPAAVGRALNVAYLVTGSVQRAGTRLRVGVELLRAGTGVRVWGDQYDRTETDLLHLQDDIATAIATGIVGRLMPQERTALAAPVGGTRDPVALNAYLLGRFYWGRRTAEDLVRAAGAFQQALARDSLYARAWSGLADAYILFLPSEYGVPGYTTDSILTLAEHAARRALALAPQLGEAWTSLGEITEYRLQWTEARAAFERGIALSPEYPTAHLWSAYDLEAWDRFEDAVREFERARELDPSSVVATLSLASAYDGVDRTADAEAMFSQAVALDPAHPLTRRFRSYHDIARGKFDQLAEDLTALRRAEGADSATARMLGERVRDPATRAAALRETAADGGATWRFLVTRHLDGDDAAFAWLRTLDPDFTKSDISSLWICGCIGSMRRDPRMRAVRARFGFPVIPQ